MAMMLSPWLLSRVLIPGLARQCLCFLDAGHLDQPAQCCAHQQDLHWESLSPREVPCSPVPVAITNGLAATAHVYISGRRSDGQTAFVNVNEELQLLPITNSSTPVTMNDHHIAHIVESEQTIHITVPDCLTSARVWIAETYPLPFSYVRATEGTSSTTTLIEPDIVSQRNVSFTFLEFANEPTQLIANPSYVDAVSRIRVSFQLHLVSGPDRLRRQVAGMRDGAVEEVCAQLQRQSQTDGWPWAKLCQKDANEPDRWLRILSPKSYTSLSADANAEFQGYFTETVDLVWNRFTTGDQLHILTQASGQPTLSCMVDASTDMLRCNDSTVAVARPTNKDVFSCAGGSFANTGSLANKRLITALAAAFNRGTLLLPRGSSQPSVCERDYYPTNHTTQFNWYSKLVHEWEQEGQGYAFPYDDFPGCSDSRDSSGLISVEAPASIDIWIR